MKTLSERNPWGYLMCIGVKDIENRTWPLPKAMKGERVLIHASARPDDRWSTGGAYDVLNRDQVNYVYGKGFKTQVFDEQMTYSAIIGSVEIVDCVINHASIWAEQSAGYSICYPNGVPASCANKKYKPIFNWVLDNPVLFKEPILNVKGKLGFWEYPMTREEFMKLSGWVKLSCMACGKEFIGPEPKMCCSGRDCGCMGMPIDPVVCSDGCFANWAFS